LGVSREQAAERLQQAGEPVSGLDDFLVLFFAPSAASQAAGRAICERRHRRVVDVDPQGTDQAMKAQIASFLDWLHIRGERFAELEGNSQTTLVVNGSNDVMIPTVNAFTLQQLISNAQRLALPIPGLFLKHARLFLDS